MQADADVDQHTPVPVDHRQFIGSNQTRSLQCLPVVTQIGRFRQPHDRLQVAQTTRAFLDVRLKIEGDIVVARVAAFLLVDFGVEESADRAGLLQRPPKFLDKREVSPNAAHFQEAGVDSDILCRFLDAFGDCAHRDARLQADVPKQTDEGFYASVCQRAVGQQHHEIDVRGGKQKTAAIATHRCDRKISRHADVARDSCDGVIYNRGVTAQIAIRLRTLAVCGFERTSLVAQPVADVFCIRGTSATVALRCGRDGLGGHARNHGLND